jgi:sulfur-oxidizing protein SoxY
MYRVTIKEDLMINRRKMLKHSSAVLGLLATAGLLPTIAHAQAGGAFEAKSLADVVKLMGGTNPVASADITLVAADIAENGAVVPLGISTNLPGVKRLMLLVEKNPNALAASFEVSDAIEANMTTRVKMGQSSNVYGVAMMNDGRVLFAQKEVKVTLGGCGG